MISHTRLLTSTKNIFALAVSLVCTAQISPMITMSTKFLRQPHTLYRPLTTSTHNNDLLYEHAKKIGNQNCSDAYTTGTCLNPVCCKNLYDALYADTADKWHAAEAINKKKRINILREIDRESHHNRIAFIKTINKDIEYLSEILKKAHWKYLYNGSLTPYKELCALIDHKHHCMLNQLRVIENDTINLWRECQTFTVRQLQDSLDKRHHIIDILALCAQEPVAQKSFKILNDQVARDRLISQQTTE